MTSNHKYLDVSALCPQYFSLPQTTVNIHIGILSEYIFTDNLCYVKIHIDSDKVRQTELIDIMT